MVKIKDRRDLEASLKDRPRDEAEIIAVRAALRALPLLVNVLRAKGASDRALLLPSFRAAFTVWVATNTPSQHRESASDFAMHDDPEKRLAASLNAYSFSLPGARIARGVSASIIGAIESVTAHTKRAAIRSACNAIEEIWSASIAARNPYLTWQSLIDSDLSDLESGVPARQLKYQALWQEEMPHWAVESWTKLKPRLMVNSREGWRVWIKWYEERLRGGGSDYFLDEVIAAIPDEIWAQGPTAANDEIKRLLNEHKGRRTGSDEEYNAGGNDLKERIKTALESGDLRSAITDFSFDELARLMRMVPFVGEIPELDDPSAARERADHLSELADGMMDLLEDIESAGKNVPPALRNNLRRYSGEAERGPADVRPGRLWDLGERLHDAMLDEDIRFGLDTLLTSALESMVDKHLNLMRVYFAAALARMRNLDEIELAPDATPDALVDALDATAKAIETADWGDTPPPEEAIPEDFADRVTELRAIKAAAERAIDPATIESLWKRFEQKAKGAAVTVLRFGVRAAEAGYKGGKIVVGTVKEAGAVARNGLAIYAIYRLLPPEVAQALTALKDLLRILLP